MKKIIIGITLLFLLMGIIAAVDINNLKCPDGWEHVAKGNYREQGNSPDAGNGRNMTVMEFTPANCDEFLENDTGENYFVFKNRDNTFTYTNWTMNQDEGCFEIVDIDGKQYFLLFSSNIDDDYKDKQPTNDIMLEFNKLNGLKPVAI